MTDRLAIIRQMSLDELDALLAQACDPAVRAAAERRRAARREEGRAIGRRDIATERFPRPQEADAA